MVMESHGKIMEKYFVKSVGTLHRHPGSVVDQRAYNSEKIKWDPVE